MDGLMLDTEQLGLENFRRVIAELGFAPLDEVYLRTIGRNWPDTKAIFIEAMGEEFPFDEMRERWRRLNDDHLSSQKVSCKPGLLELLDLIQGRGLPTAVATSTSRANAARLLERVGLLHRFKTIVGGDEVQNGKPHPEIFLTAAKRLDVDPAHCVVFEDSAPGIRGAQAAGMIPVLVPDLVPPPPDVLAIAHRAFKSLHEACDLFPKTRRAFDVWFDGACGPVNPGGTAAFGYAVYENDVKIAEGCGVIGRGPSMSNNVAEYCGVIEAAKYIRTIAPGSVVRFHGDSNLVVQQLSGKWKARQGLYMPYHHEARQLCTELKASFHWIPREKNAEADALSKRPIEQQS